MRYFKRLSLLVLLGICISETGKTQSRYIYSEPENISDNWPTQNLFSIVKDSSYIYGFFNQLASKKHKIHSAVLVKNGAIVFEEYYDGQDINTRHDMRSVSKSVYSLLLGIAIDRGFIQSINDPVLKYIKDRQVKKNPDKRKPEMTFSDFLTMSSGLDCNDWDKKSKGQEDKVYRKKDWIQYTLDLPVIHDPGTVTAYCTMGVTLVAEAIRQASNMEIDEFAETYLFKPLQITNAEWGHTSKKKNIPSSAKRLYTTSRNLAKIGQLILNEGKWDSKQIVSKEWIANSTRRHTRLANLDYGFWWWNMPFKHAEKQFNAISATGNGGQYIFVIKELNAVAVFTGGAYNSEESNLPFGVVNNVFIPTLAGEN